MPVWILKPLLFYPDLIFQLILYILADFFNRRALVNLFPVFKYFHLKIFERAVLKASFFPVLLRINIPDRFGGIDCFISTGEIIRNGFSLFIVNTVDLLQPRAVIFSAVSETLILGINFPSLCIAESL